MYHLDAHSSIRILSVPLFSCLLYLCQHVSGQARVVGPEVEGLCMYIPRGCQNNVSFASAQPCASLALLGNRAIGRACVHWKFQGTETEVDVGRFNLPHPQVGCRQTAPTTRVNDAVHVPHWDCTTQQGSVFEQLNTYCIFQLLSLTVSDVSDSVRRPQKEQHLCVHSLCHSSEWQPAGG